MPRRLRAIGLVVLGTVLLASCAPPEPVTISSEYVPADARHRRAATAETAHATTCAVRIEQVTDARDDPTDLGSIGPQKLLMADTAGWVRSGFTSLGNGSEIQIVGVDDPRLAKVAIQIEILKAYVMTITSETRSVNVVLRVDFVPVHGAADTRIYRGTSDNIDWTAGGGESAASLNFALGEILAQASGDILARCR